jgi:hypothetical protein
VGRRGSGSFPGEISPKSEIKNIKNIRQKLVSIATSEKKEKKKGKNRRVSILGFQCVARNGLSSHNSTQFHTHFLQGLEKFRQKAIYSKKVGFSRHK